MKKMTCKQLGGVCDKEFKADSFEEIVEMSKNHGMEMFMTNDADHLKVMDEMKKMMQNPEDMKKWFESKKNEFNELPDTDE